MVSGFVIPPDATEAVQPAHLRQAFAEAFPAYDCNGLRVGQQRCQASAQRKATVQQWAQLLRTWQEALEWLLEREPVDFLWVVFEGLDRL